MITIQVQNEAQQIHLDNHNYVCGSYEMVNLYLFRWLHIQFDVLFQSVQSRTHDCCDNNYALQQDVESLSEAKEDEGQYWEPAATVNELYRQMACKKYREIDPQQVE
jgi:hypothetical protein